MKPQRENRVKNEITEEVFLARTAPEEIFLLSVCSSPASVSLCGFIVLQET